MAKKAAWEFMDGWASPDFLGLFSFIPKIYL